MTVKNDELTKLIQRGNEGDTAARDALVGLIYDELHRLAKSRARGEGETMRPTALVNEVFLKLFGAETQFANRNHLMAHAALAMRQLVLRKAEKAKAKKRGGSRHNLTLQDVDGSEALEANYLELNQALEDLERIQPRPAQILTLAYFGGFNNSEIAEFLDLTERTVYRDLRLAKSWLKMKLTSEQEN